MVTDKDIEITVVALFKSIIESGAEPHTWEARLKDALNTFHKTCTAIKAKLAKKDTNTNG